MTQAEPQVNMPSDPVFILTIDTEEEWDWSGKLPTPPFSTENIDQIPEFQKICQQIAIRPTYFVDYAVANNRHNVSIIKHFFDQGLCDFGAHLHPWANPPITEIVNDENSHAINLPDSLIEQKIATLTEKLEGVFGCHPYSYRAGRWGINSEHLKILWRHGYQVDSSIRPFYKDRYFAYNDAPTSPYFPGMSNAAPENGDRIGILEIPVTSGFTNANFEVCNVIHSKLSEKWLKHSRAIGILWRLGLLRKVTVTPEGNSYEDVRACIDASIKRGDNVINMFFHSSNLLPGKTPYVRNAKDKQKMLDCIMRSADHMRNKYDAKVLCMREIKQQLLGSS